MSTVTITGAAVVAQSAATTPTAGSGQLLTAVLVSIAVIIALITWLKLHPFLALVLGSALLAVLAGIPIANTFASFIKGLGATTGDVGVLIALGAMIGKLLADSGGADRVVDTILGRTAERRLPWAMALIAFVIGIPLFFEIGVVLLIPVVLLVALRARRSVIVVGIPALAGLSVLHGLVPPHPGPLIAVSALNASVGLTLGLGLLVAVPTVAIAGPLLAKPMARWVALEPPAELTPAPDEDAHPVRTPAFGWVLATILLPVVLMLGRTVTDSTLPQRNQVRVIADFVGSPLVALLVATLVAMVTLGRGAGFGRVRLQESIGSALPPIAAILLIVGAGGGFKQTLVDTGVAQVIADATRNLSISVLVVGWLVAVFIRLATGSATVATITAAGIVAPLAADLDPVRAALLALAVGAGSLFFSHVNDAGFWLVKEYFGMTVGQTLRTWSVMETVISVVALVFILLLGWVL